MTEPARTMLGEEQEAWLGDALTASDAGWNVLAQQVVMTRLALIPGTDDLFNLDQWDGYPASRTPRETAGTLGLRVLTSVP